MKVYIADEAGFCFGVVRALDIINEIHHNGHEIHVLGQLVHNRTILQELEAKGISCIDSLSHLEPGLASGRKLVVRTHGIPVGLEQELLEKEIDYTDATCPLVKKLHKIASKEPFPSENKENPVFVIAGDPNHPEILAAHSYAPHAVIIADEEQARQLEPAQSISVMAQTTYDTDRFKAICTILEQKTKSLNVHNTICNASIVRQSAIRKLAPTVDFVIVIGGKNSSNTRKLYQIAQQGNPNTYWFESYSQMTNDGEFPQQYKEYESVGITAGASTPPEEIEKIEIFFKNINSKIVKEI